MSAAQIGDLIEFEHKSYKCRGIVFNVYENSVAVDVSQNACFVKEGIESTIKKHTAYKIVKGSEDGADTDKLRGIKTISNYSKSKERLHLSEQLYDRSDLTKERYFIHKNEEKLSDNKICGLYGIPTGSWTKIKKDLLGSAPTEKEFKPKEKVAAPIEQTPVTEKKVIAIEVHDREVNRLNAIIEQLTQENTQLSVALDETQVSKQELEVKVHDSNKLHVELIAGLEKDNNDLKELLSKIMAERDNFEILANDSAMEVERLQREVTTYVQSQQTESPPVDLSVDKEMIESLRTSGVMELPEHEDGCSNCTEMREKFESQLAWFENFELYLHERIVSLLKR